MIRFLSIFLLLFAVGCTPKTMDASQLASASSGKTFNPQEYRLASGDKIRVTVFNEQTLTGEFLIGTDGSLSFPLIGAVNAGGRTPGELSTELTKRLGDGYLTNPRVSIEVLIFRPFYIMGEVNKPGRYPFAAGLTVLNAVATAEGFTYRAERRVAYIRRDNAPEEIPVRITATLQIEPGDTIRIGERYF
jgi:polysaccharide biosynthesis/export protein